MTRHGFGLVGSRPARLRLPWRWWADRLGVARLPLGNGGSIPRSLSLERAWTAPTQNAAETMFALPTQPLSGLFTPRRSPQRE
jgi:hypothetical protein